MYNPPHLKGFGGYFVEADALLFNLLLLAVWAWVWTMRDKMGGV
jgi:hypothetical protein